MFLVPLPRRTVQQLLVKLNIHLPYDSSNFTPRCCFPQRMHTKTYKGMFIAALVFIEKIGNNQMSTNR